MSLILLKNVFFSFEDNVALNNISLEINKGEAIGLQGDNGSGKSTLLKILNGLIFPTKGEYYFNNMLINEHNMKNDKFAKNLHQQIGYVFQNSESQLFCSSVKEEIQFALYQIDLSNEEIETRTNDVMKLMNIEHLSNRAPYHLSGGEKKKTALASIIAMNPEVLVLDEPMSGLDRKSRDILLNFLSLWKDAGKTLIVATHENDILTKITDRIITIDENHNILI